jgi:hypothetical protein
MPDRARKLLADAMTLPDEECLDLADQLLSSLPADEEWLGERARERERGAAKATARLPCAPTGARCDRTRRATRVVRHDASRSSTPWRSQLLEAGTSRLSFDGTGVATWMTSRGRSGTVQLACGM